MKVKDNLNYVVILGASPTALSVLREVCESYTNVLILSLEEGCALYSNYTNKKNRVRFQYENKLLDFINTLSCKSNLVLIPTSDRYVEFIASNNKSLSKCKFQSSYTSESVDKVLDKNKFYKACELSNVSYPKTHLIKPNQLPSSLDLKFPCILKPISIHKVKEKMKGKKVLKLQNSKDYNNAVELIRESNSEWLAQEIVQGPESNIFLVVGIFEDGEFSQLFTANKVRQYPPGFGSASYVVSVKKTELTDISRAILKTLEWNGIFSLEYKIDLDNGLYKAIEMNPRVSLWYGIARFCGKKVVSQLILNLLGKQGLDEKRQIENIAWAYKIKDTYSAIYYILNKDNNLLPEPVFDKFDSKKTVNAVWELKDPLPFVVEIASFSKKFVKRLI